MTMCSQLEYHIIRAIGNIVQNDRVEDGAALANEVHAISREMNATRQVQIHQSTTALPHCDGLKTFTSELS